MAFGLNFGMNKSKSSTNSTTSVDKTVTGTEATTGTKSSTGSTTSTGSQNTQTGSTTNNATTNTGNTTGSQQSTQTSTQFGAATLAGLEQSVAALLGGMPGATQLPGSFNREQFVADNVAAAEGRVNSELDSSLNSMYDQFGGRDDQNSMAALLANRARGDAAANIAGVRAQSEQTGQQIEMSRFGAQSGATQNFLGTVLQALKGGTTTQTGQVLTAEQRAQQENQTGTQTGYSNQQTAQQQTQLMTELLAQLVNSNQNTKGTETTNSKTKGSQIGGGAGLSL